MNKIGRLLKLCDPGEIDIHIYYIVVFKYIDKISKTVHTRA